MGLGYMINLPVMSLIGALLLFGLGMTMLNVDVEVKTGDISTISYNGSIAESISTTYEYENYDFGTLGQSSISFIILILGAVLFVLFIFRLGD